MFLDLTVVVGLLTEGITTVERACCDDRAFRFLGESPYTA